MPVNTPKPKASATVRLAPPPPQAVQVNQSVAPVCPISQSQSVPPQLPPKRPGLPLVTDLPSVINVLNQVVQMLNSPPQSYQETNRVTQTVRIYNPNDKEQYVDVERINFLRLEDQGSGSDVVWEY